VAGIELADVDADSPADHRAALADLRRLDTLASWTVRAGRNVVGIRGGEGTGQFERAPHDRVDEAIGVGVVGMRAHKL